MRLTILSGFFLLVATTAASLFAMMAFTFADVVMRYLFARPVRGGLEVVELLIAGAALLYVLLNRQRFRFATWPEQET